MEKNPRDHGLKAQFIKFCLLNRFTKHETQEDHIADALRLFGTIDHASAFDLQCHYLVGKYYQEDKDLRKAYSVYLNAIKLFNRYVGKNPDLKSENVELAYSIALSVMTLQLNPIDPELEVCFKIIRKSFPLHVKRIEFENEMAKPAPDPARIKQLTEELRKLKAEEDKESAAPAQSAPVVISSAKETASAAPPEKNSEAPAVKEKAVEASGPKPKEKEDIFTKLFRVPIPDPKNLPGPAKKMISSAPEEEEFFKLTPVSQTHQGSSFMVFQNDNWEGPFTSSQLRSMGFLKPETWVCRVGSQLVTQAYEVPDLHSLIHQQV